jgi:hypothetical protein
MRASASITEEQEFAREILSDLQSTWILINRRTAEKRLLIWLGGGIFLFFPASQGKE